jgi:hypothetical protein
MVKRERRENIHSHIHEVFVVRGRGRVLHAVPDEVLGLLCVAPKA